MKDHSTQLHRTLPSAIASMNRAERRRAARVIGRGLSREARRQIAGELKPPAPEPEPSHQRILRLPFGLVIARRMPRASKASR